MNIQIVNIISPELPWYHLLQGSSQTVRLYKVTGTSTLRMKATEVSGVQFQDSFL